jgi:hypothetical protein
MRLALDPTGHWVPRTKPTCLLHTWRPHRRRPFALVLHLHQHQSSRNLHLHYLDKNQSTQRCQSLIIPGSDHPPVLEPHMVLTLRSRGLQGADALSFALPSAAALPRARRLQVDITACDPALPTPHFQRRRGATTPLPPLLSSTGSLGAWDQRCCGLRAARARGRAGLYRASSA